MSEEQGHSVAPGEGHGPSLTNTQPSPVLSDPAPLGHVSAVSMGTPGVLADHSVVTRLLTD